MTWHVEWVTGDPESLIFSTGPEQFWHERKKLLLLYPLTQPEQLVWLWWDRVHGTWHPLDPTAAGSSYYTYAPCPYGKEPQ